ncbi:hypothetical protein [Nocardia tengchongensis]|uniref:hypothetical protein n=1 Tax=Nocardia tengchongensis TaxID=2055889 RepID=UPI00360DB25A
MPHSDRGQGYEIAEHPAFTLRNRRLGLLRFDLANSAPRCGRAVFLSARRAALAPEALPATYIHTAHDGLVIDLTGDGTQSPAIETILEANIRLRAAGAMEELPIPFDRATF